VAIERIYYQVRSSGFRAFRLACQSEMEVSDWDLRSPFCLYGFGSKYPRTRSKDKILANPQVSYGCFVQDYCSRWPSSFMSGAVSTSSEADFLGPFRYEGWAQSSPRLNPVCPTSARFVSGPRLSRSHSGDWRSPFVLPISDDETVRVAVIIRLRHNLCVPHQCRCGAQVDAVGLHSFVCNKQAASQHPLNYVQELFHQPAYTSRQWANRSLPQRQWTPW